MRTLKAIGLTLVVSLIVFLASRHALHLADERESVLLRRRGQIEREIRQVQQRIAQDSMGCAELRSALAAVVPPRSRRAATALEPASVQRARYIAVVHKQYQRFYEMARLSAGQTAGFEALMAAQREELIEQFAASGDAMDAAEARELKEQSDAHFRPQEYQLLGDADFQLLRQFQCLLALPPIVEKIALDAGDISRGMSSETQWQLEEVLAGASTAYLAGGNADPNTIDWNAALTRAQAILSPSQWEGLQTYSFRNRLDRLRAQFFGE